MVRDVDAGRGYDIINVNTERRVSSFTPISGSNLHTFRASWEVKAVTCTTSKSRKMVIGVSLRLVPSLCARSR
jgi:hypothetical protein